MWITRSVGSGKKQALVVRRRRGTREQWMGGRVYGLQGGKLQSMDVFVRVAARAKQAKRKTKMQTAVNEWMNGRMDG